jgi:hypothetical protein
MKKIILLLLCSTWNLAIAQIDPVQELAQLQKQYAQLSSLYYEMEYKLFDNKNNKLLESIHADMYVEGKSYYCKIGTIEYLVQQGQAMNLDHAQKRLQFYANASTVQKKGLLKVAQPKDWLKQTGIKPTVTTLQADRRKMTLTLPDAQQVQVYYKSGTYQLESVERLVPHPKNRNEWMRLEVHFKTIAQKSIPIQMNQYVSKKANAYHPTEAYKNYEFNQIK